jgi:hypothetical protein
VGVAIATTAIAARRMRDIDARMARIEGGVSSPARRFAI